MSRRPIKNRPSHDRHPSRRKQPVRGDVPSPDQHALPVSGSARNRYVIPVICALLLLAVALVFGGTLRNQFVNYDDRIYVYENPQVIAGLTGPSIAWAFTSGHASNWHPLTWLSHMLDCELYGLNPWGHHLSSVLLHGATAVILFLVLWRMSGSPWPSAFAATVFAIHPLRVESVAWAAERKDVLSGLFFVLILGAYAGYAQRPFSIFRYLSVIVLFALGLMSKPVLVTVPFVLLLLDYWPLGRMATSVSLQGRRKIVFRLIIEKIPLFALSAASCIVTSFAQKGAMAGLEMVPFFWRIGNAVVSYAVYLRQFVCPTGLAVCYPHQKELLPLWQIAVAVLLLFVISAVCFAWRRRFPYLLVGWLWYLGMLVPMIGLVQVGTHALADRYTYLPQIGLCIAFAWGAAEIVAVRPQWRLACGVGAVLALVVLAGCARQQVTYWRDSDTLWRRTLACTTNNAMAHYNFGTDFSDRGMLKEAKVQYEAALKINPYFSWAHNNLGLALDKLGQKHEAIAHFRKALEISPNRTDVLGNIGVSLVAVGQVDEAIKHYLKALEIDPNCAIAHNNYGMVLMKQGQVEQGIEHYRKAMEAEPNNHKLHYNLGVSLVNTGRIDEAIAEYKLAIEGKPADSKTYNNMGRIYARRGQFEEAITNFRRAVDADQRYSNAYFNLGTVLFESGRPAEGVVQWQKAAQLNPTDVVLHNQLAWMLATFPDAAVRNGGKAVEFAQQASRLSGEKQPAVLDTLAAAYAEAGRFAEAVDTAQKAMELATQQNNPILANSIRAKMSLYEAGTPFRDVSLMPTTNSPAP